MTTDELASRFAYVEGDEDTDPTWVLKADEDWSIQDSRAYGGGFGVNKWNPDDRTMTHHFERSTLDDAMFDLLVLFGVFA